MADGTQEVMGVQGANAGGVVCLQQEGRRSRGPNVFVSSLPRTQNSYELTEALRSSI